MKSPKNRASQSMFSLEKSNFLNMKNQKFMESIQQEYKYDNVYADSVLPPPPPPPLIIIPDKPIMFDS